MISKSKPRDIERNLDSKVAFFANREVLEPALGPVLEKLHKYRNEMYHRDKLQREVLKPATLIYFDSACTALESYKPPIMAFTGNQLVPELSRFTGGSSGFLEMDLPQRIAAQLRCEVGLDLPQVRSVLAQYLTARLDEITEGLTFIEDNLGGPAPRARRCPAPRAGEPCREPDPRTGPRKEYLYSKTDMEQWRSRISALESITDKHELVREYAAIEDAFEPFEELVEKAVMAVDRDVQLQIDIARGK